MGWLRRHEAQVTDRHAAHRRDDRHHRLRHQRQFSACQAVRRADRGGGAVTETTAKNTRILVPVLVGALVAVVLGFYGANHKPGAIVLGITGFANLARAKSWMASIAAAFAVVQLISALIMYGKIRVFGNPSWIGGLHRWSGRL